MTDTPLRRTPLYDAHVRAGARMVPFGGWEMPVQYTGIVEEHRIVRGAVGCFDVSHMGEFEVEGPAALAALQRLTTNDVAALDVGQVQYSLLCTPAGGIVDDLTVYRLAADRFMVTVNASNIATTFSTGTLPWMLCTVLNINPPSLPRISHRCFTSSLICPGVPNISVF